MKVVLVGASPLAVFTAELLLRRGDEVVIVEMDRDKIGDLTERLDCGFIHGDGTRPAVLREVGPEDASFLLCLTDSDRDNILAALVGRSLGFKRVVPKIEDAEFEHICTELGLSDTIVPDQSVARALTDMIGGRTGMDISNMVRGEVRFYSFVAREQDTGAVDALDLPRRTRLICIYRNDEFLLPDPGTELAKGDEVVLITHSDELPALAGRWGEP
jgi:trk system potassium uptake protein TrkA